jgi:hypothetical protein
MKRKENDKFGLKTIVMEASNHMSLEFETKA